jgi:Na+/proline symporter
VRDFYQRLVRPQASTAEIKRLTYVVMILVGAVAFVANINPVEKLQALVVFSGSGGATAFVIPAAMACYWRRATAAGAFAAMAAGATTHVTLYAIGFLQPDPMIGQATSFRPYYLLGIDPMIWGLAVSLTCGVVVSLMTSPPSAQLVSRLFDTSPPALT